MMQNVPPPEAIDYEPRYMPDGSLDWHWFHQQQDILEAWWYAGLCVRCGMRPKANGMAVCLTTECESKRTKRYGHRDRCDFCGRKYGLSATNSGGFGGPTTPVHVQYCPDCSGRRPPPREEAVGQGRFF